jgi:predicted TIM-barrel fold metal-dependent hydrolase
MNAVVPYDGRASQIREGLDHPVIDADGHLIPFMPLVLDLAADLAGKAVADRLGRYLVSRESEARGFLPARSFFGLPARNTLDRMTATLPRLLYRRLDELGIDLAMLYPTGLGMLTCPDDEVRQAATRAYNTYIAEAYAPYRDRLEPVAMIPVFTPGEAVAELDVAVNTLGLKAVVMSGVVPRMTRSNGTAIAWVDCLGHGSFHNYDPLWDRCSKLGVVPTFHGIGYGWGSRVSSNNYVFNHLGNFAAAQEAVCRSLVMGGVPGRFSELRFAFLEGGVAWGAQLLADLIGHHAKRNAMAVRAYDPATLDVAMAGRLFEEFAEGQVARYSNAVSD